MLCERVTISVAVCPIPSLTVMLTGVTLESPLVGELAVNTPPVADGDVTVTSAVFELTAVKDVTPVSLAVKFAE